MDTSTIRRFREYIRRIERELDIQNNASCSGGVSLPKCHVILELFPDKSTTLNGLARKLRLDKSTVSRTVESLVRDGYVERSIPVDNRRSVNLSITKKGAEEARRINRENDAYFGAILESLPREDLPVFLGSFEQFVNRMVESNRDKTQC